MTFKSFILAAVLSVLFSAVMPGVVQAQNSDAPPLKIVIVNVEAVRSQSQAFKKAMTQIKSYSDEINVELDAESEDLRKANEELGRKRTLLAPDAFAAERKAFEERVAAFQRKVQARQKAITETRAKAMAEIDRKIVEIISQYAEANNVSLVLPETVIVLSAKSMNINGYVLENLNKALPSVEVQAPSK